MSEEELKRIVFGIIFFKFVSLGAFSQSGLFNGEVISQNAVTSSLNPHFDTVTAFQLNAEALSKFVRRPDYNGRIDLKIGSHSHWQMLLTEHDIRSPEFKLRLRRRDRIVNGAKTQNITFRGYIIGMPSSKIRLSIQEDFLYGFIDDGETLYFIEPLVNFMQAPGNQYIIYRKEDLKISKGGHACGLVAMEKTVEDLTGNQHIRSSPPACLLTELAIAMDYSYVDHHGGEIGALNQAIAVMNTVDPNFNDVFESDIDFHVIECFISTTPGGDPPEWTSTVDGGILLPNFRSWGNSGGFVSDFDLGQLWTKRNFHYENNYSVVGLAYTGTTCYYSRFHLLEHYTSSAASLRVLTAHEIGHNFGASHDTLTTSYIMKPSINSGATSFSQESIDYVNPSLASRTCLSSNCTTSCDYLVTITPSDPNGTYEALGHIHTSGSVTIQAATIFDAPQVILAPEFTSNNGVVFEIRNDGCN